MRVLALVGSPRKGGNTDILVDALLESARGRGHAARKVHLRYHHIKPCIDCRGCKQGDGVCTVDDGMQDLYPLLEEADAVVFGTPVYWLGPTGTMKMFLDRLRPYVANGKLKGKRALLVAPAKDGPGDAALLTEQFRRSFEWLQMEYGGHVHGTGYEAGEIREDASAMQQAAALGEGL